MAGAVITLKGVAPALFPQVANVLRAYLRGSAESIDIELDPGGRNAYVTLTDVREWLVPGFSTMMTARLKGFARDGFDAHIV